jgi:hypothetical protein
VEAMIELDNYIDYVICNTYTGPDDWCTNNWRAAQRAAKGNTPAGKWNFFIWDAEWALRPGEHKDGVGDYVSPDPAKYLVCNGPMTLNHGLKDYAPDRKRFSDRVKKHFFLNLNDSTTGGLAVVDGVDRAVQLFQNQMALFEQVIFCESARWGGMDNVGTNRKTPFTKSDPGYLPDESRARRAPAR